MYKNMKGKRVQLNNLTSASEITQIYSPSSRAQSQAEGLLNGTVSTSPKGSSGPGGKAKSAF